MAGAYKKPVAPKKPVAKAATKVIKPVSIKATKKPSVAQNMQTARRPAVGADKAAAKKYGKSSWNNGYTN